MYRKSLDCLDRFVSFIPTSSVVVQFTELVRFFLVSSVVCTDDSRMPGAYTIGQFFLHSLFKSILDVI